MKQTIDKNQFMDAFQNMNREDNFTYAGLDALFNYLEEYEESTGEEIELDVIALCYDFTEYEDLAEFQNNYGAEYETIEHIQDETMAIEISGSDSFIIQNF